MRRTAPRRDAAPQHFHSLASFPGFLRRENNGVGVWRVFGTDLTRGGRAHGVLYRPLSVLHTCKHRRSWHIWSHIQGRTINFTQKGPPRALYKVCRLLRLTQKS